MKRTKVYVRLFDGTTFWGKVFVKPDERLQDLLNDKRKFIPVERLDDKRSIKSDDTYVTVVLHKDGIHYMEER